MNISDQKGKILDQAVQTRKPKTTVELGTYVGYSSLRIVFQLPDDALLIMIEFDSQSAKIAHSIHEYANNVANYYLEYILNNPNYTTKFHEATVGYRDDVPDEIDISIRK